MAHELSPTVLFEDTHLIVLDKPAGLLSQGEHTGDENLVDWLRGYFGRNYVGLIHRLDRNTSGVMVVAKRTKAARRLTEALRDGKLIRTYTAWLNGNLKKPARWQHILSKDEKRNIVSVAAGNKEGAKTAVLSVIPVRHIRYQGRDLTLAEFRLETGRSHQIRVQSAHEGHPVFGDTKYGGSHCGETGRPLLHSRRIEFPHPMSGEILKFEAPLPEDMKLKQVS